MNASGPLGDLHWREFRNDSGEEIPAFACLRITSSEVIEAGRVVLTAAKPNTYGAQYDHCFNGPLKVAAGKYGLCTRSDGAVALYDSGDGSPGWGESWGPRSGTWKLKKNTGGFRIEGISSTSKTLAIVRPFPMLRVHGQTDAAHAKDATGVVSIFYRSASGTYTDSGENFTNVLNSFCAITAANKDVEMVWDGGNGSDYWSIVAGEI